jgi:hypothetical protein
MDKQKFLPSFDILKFEGNGLEAWVTSPASHNDTPKLELPGTWAPPESSGPSPNGERETAHFCFSDGNY